MRTPPHRRRRNRHDPPPGDATKPTGNSRPPTSQRHAKEANKAGPYLIIRSRPGTRPARRSISPAARKAKYAQKAPARSTREGRALFASFAGLCAGLAAVPGRHLAGQSLPRAESGKPFSASFASFAGRAGSPALASPVNVQHVLFAQFAEVRRVPSVVVLRRR